MTERTPGPWTLSGPQSVSPIGLWVQNTEDAALIARAPEMEDALRKLADVGDELVTDLINTATPYECEHDWFALSKAVEEARAALGETP